jgi:hypothetical protein
MSLQTGLGWDCRPGLDLVVGDELRLVLWEGEAKPRIGAPYIIMSRPGSEHKVKVKLDPFRRSCM